MNLLEINPAILDVVLNALLVLVPILVPWIGLKLKWHLDKIDGTKAALTSALAIQQTRVDRLKKAREDGVLTAEEINDINREWAEGMAAAATKGGLAWFKTLDDKQVEMLRESSVAIVKSLQK